MRVKPFKVSYVSLGCAKNQVDLEYLIGGLTDSGFVTETEPEKCDAVIINTCGFIESAVKEAIENILLMKSKIPSHSKLIVTGCMAQRYKDDILKEMPEIDFVTGVGKLEEAADYLRSISNIDKKGSGRVITNYPYYAYIKISEGCNNCCSYCTIPSIRGRLKSREPQDIIKEAGTLVATGVKELIII
ncbi:MAG: radical SAM protein, partial [Deferribacterales bacterium]|nr:radical SAM protein [Deferribacterales bacterium]